MTVTIGQSRPGTWIAISGSQIVAWDTSYSGLMATVRRNGWTLAM